MAVVTHNDGDDPADVIARYADFTKDRFISVHVGAQSGGRTLEPQLLAANDRDTLNSIFGTSFTADDEMVDYMTANKTTCALAIFESRQP